MLISPMPERHLLTRRRRGGASLATGTGTGAAERRGVLSLLCAAIKDCTTLSTLVLMRNELGRLSSGAVTLLAEMVQCSVTPSTWWAG